jgi:hypothetical protein
MRLIVIFFLPIIKFSDELIINIQDRALFMVNLIIKETLDNFIITSSEAEHFVLKIINKLYYGHQPF